jgi:hypothetical protein
MIVAEAALVLAPVTLVAAMGFAWSARRLVVAVAQGDWEDPTTWLALMIAAGLVGTAAGWWLTIRYLRRDSGALAQGACIAWTGAWVGLAAALGGAWFALRGNGWIFALGLPALLPFAHLWRLRRTCR